MIEHRRRVRVATTVLLALALTAPGAVARQGASGGPGVSPAAADGPRADRFLALSAPQAAAYRPPADLRLVSVVRLGAERLERYQQVFGPLEAHVVGGQVTLRRDAAGRIRLVGGRRFESIVAANRVVIGRAQAERVAVADVGAAGRRLTDLVIDPASGRYRFRVETRRFAERWIHEVDAATGRLVQRIDALETDHGLGVKGDTKSLSGLSTWDAANSRWQLVSGDGRQRTSDYRNLTNGPVIATDADGHFTATGRTSPGSGALVDAQAYARTTDAYLQARHGLDLVACTGNPAMASYAHYASNYNNAFWNGTQAVFGDGDGTSYREFSGGLDVVAHEYGHGVDDCFQKLVYQDQPGALNESFSDIIGASAEAFAAEPTSSNCRLASGQTACTDWWIAEDVHLNADLVPGFRNMADPQEDADPDHYSERLIGSTDNGYVHSNSGIPNHAFYLLATGGQNAGCGGATSGHTHSADCGVTVTGVGREAAEHIWFDGITTLTSTSDFCDARAATVAAAGSRYGAASTERTATLAAWAAVGLGNAVCGALDFPAGTVHVGDLDRSSSNSGRTWTARVTITVHDASEGAVSGAVVSGTWSGGPSASCTTGSTGSCTLTRSGIAKKTGSVTFTVTGVVVNGVTYDASVNHDPDGDSNGTSITVSKP